MQHHMCQSPEPPPSSRGVRLISRATLEAKLTAGQDFEFVMALDQLRYDQAHIDGSTSFDDFSQHLDDIPREREIVIYCTDAACAASKVRAAFLVEQGFTNVLRYAGGLADWAAAGLPLSSSVAA